MAVAQVIKLLVATHKSEELKVIKTLQKKALAEVKPYIPPEQSLAESESALEVLKIIEQVKKTLEIIENFKSKDIKKIASKAGKLVVQRHEYESIASRDDLQTVVEDIIKYEQEIRVVESEIFNLKSRINYLQSWQVYKGKISDLKNTEYATVKLGLIKARAQDFLKIVANFEKKGISYEILSSNKEIKYLIIAYHNNDKEEAENYLKEVSFEQADLFSYPEDTIHGNILILNKSLEYHLKRKTNLERIIKETGQNYERDLIIYLDFLENNFEVEKIIGLSLSTDYASFYTLWIKESEKDKLFSELQRFKNTKAYIVKPEKDEEIPIVLENKPIFKPFEIIINLYGVPKYFEIDPTPYVSLFFLIFFGLCLTDAGYGLIFILLSAFIYFKLKDMKKFALLILLLGIFTVIAGALFNGWFGDLPFYLKIDRFFSPLALLGDPMKSDAGAMNFFRLALLLGVIQVVFGLFVRFFDSIIRKNYQKAFLDTLPWIIIVISLVMMLLSTTAAVNMQIVDAPLFPLWISKILIWLLIPSALTIILFSARAEKSWGFRIFMGFLNLTIVSGITSYLGDFLSYIRLMALGLVTAGIGVAINKIAFQFGSFPVIGVIIIIVGLIFGHIFNIGINTLGGFVHTLRLQYVEFFSKFYEGGGKAFEAFKEEHKYVTIID